MANLINYKDFAEKDEQFYTSCKIDDENTLDDKIEELSANVNLIYRGLNNAAFRLYTSTQRHFILQDAVYQKFGNKPYHEYIRETINLVRSDNNIMNYFTSNNILVNDFLILALLQHYANCSPLLDFAYDIYHALFFAQDGSISASGNGTIEDYISVYFADNRIDWLQATIQSINQHGAINADAMLADVATQGKYQVDATDSVNSMKNLTYEDYIDGISFLTIAGANKGITNVIMKHLNDSWQYNINNPRLNTQNGLFIFNSSDQTPLIEQINSVTKHRKIFGCLNINKKLIPYIKSIYLEPKGLTKANIYCQSPESKSLEAQINALFKV